MDAAVLACIFASVLLHELGHALTARSLGVRIVSIVMYPIGGVARLASQPAPREELWITAAGPAVNLVLALALFGVERALDLTGEVRGFVRDVASANVALLLFNLIPAFPMDGGRLLRSFLALRKPEAAATKIATVVGRAVAVLMAIYAIYSAHYFLLFIALMVFTGAQREQVVSDARRYSTGVTVSDAMVRDFRTLEHGSTIGEAAQLLLATAQHDFPVLHAGRPVGLLTRAALIGAMNSGGPSSSVAAAMKRDFLAVAPDADLANALPMMEKAGSSAIVTDGERVLGLLTPDNVGEFFALRAAQSR